jgi:transaldolase
MTMPHAWQVRFNESGIEPVERMSVPVEPWIIEELTARIPDFSRAYEPDGLTPAEFDTYGATARTLRGFIKSYYDLVGTVNDIVLPNPDKR